MNKHDKAYVILLMIVEFLWTVGACSIWTFMKDNHLKNMIVSVYASLVVLTVITLTMRLRKSSHARVVTIATNIIYLPFFPIGTAVGVYGLWKVDRKQKPR